MNFQALNRNLRERVPFKREDYYILFENLGTYVELVIKKNDLDLRGVTLVEGSTNSAVVKLKLKDKILSLKIPSDKYVIPEVFFLKTLGKNDISAPRLFAYDVSEATIPFPYLITEWVDGAECFSSHVNDRVANIGGQVYARELFKVHKIETSGFGNPLDVNGEKWSCSNWLDAINEFFARVVSLNTPRLLFRTDCRLLDKLTINNTLLRVTKPHLLHGDTPNGLMKIEPQIQLLAFIDPAGIISGDFMYDVSSIYCIDENGELGTGFMSGFIDEYRQLMKFDNNDRYRFECLRLFHFYWKACFFFDNGWHPESLQRRCFNQLEKVKKL